MRPGTVIIAVLSSVGVPTALVGYSYVADAAVNALPGKRAKRVLRPWLWLLPAIVLLAVFLLYPAFRTIYLSFFGPQSEVFVGLTNYRFVFSHDAMLVALRNNGLWLVTFTSFVVVVGLLMAVLTDRVKYESVAKSFLFMPMAISYVAAGVIWKFMYQYRPAGETQIGTINAALTSVFQSFEPVAWTVNPPWSNFALIAIGVWIWTGFSMVILSAAIKGVSDDLIDSARIDGANPWQVFRRIIIPIISSTIVVVVTTMVINVLKIFDIVYVMTNGRLETEVIANRMYKELFNYQYFGRASAIATLLFIAVLPVIGLNIKKSVRK